MELTLTPPVFDPAMAKPSRFSFFLALSPGDGKVKERPRAKVIFNNVTAVITGLR